MKSLSAALLLLTFQFLIASVLALPSHDISSSSPIKCNAFTGTGCHDDEYCAFSSYCTKKYTSGTTCAWDSVCSSGICDKSLHTVGGVGKCAQECNESLKCPDGFRCAGSACLHADQPIASHCEVDGDCQSNLCLSSLCQPSDAKKVGEDCNDTDTCQIGSMCFEGSCSTRGYKPDGTLGGSCYDAKYRFQCFTSTSYCDITTGLTCQPRKFAGEPCGVKVFGINIPARDQCASDRCVDGGFCGAIIPGSLGEPCSDDQNICLEENECKDAAGDGVNGPKKTCQRKRNPDVGKTCNGNYDCPSLDTRCYSGSGNATCQTTGNIEGRACKSEDECGGFSRTRVPTNFGAYDGVDGGWGIQETDIGFRCTGGKCHYVYETSQYQFGGQPYRNKQHQYLPRLEVPAKHQRIG